MLTKQTWANDCYLSNHVTAKMELKTNAISEQRKIKTRLDTGQSSRGWLGRSSNAKTAWNSKMLPTNLPTNTAGCRVACPRLKTDWHQMKVFSKSFLTTQIFNMFLLVSMAQSAFQKCVFFFLIRVVEICGGGNNSKIFLCHK